MRKRSLLTVAIFGLILATVAFAFPGQTACAMIGVSGLETLSDGTRVQTSSTSVERLQIFELQQQAKARITKAFGLPRAKPTIIFLKDPSAFFPFRFNGYGSTHTIGSRACVIIGPEGTNLNVVAHELMHAELFDRVGVWRKLTAIPAWFDEGVAMQVDFRPAYDLKQPIKNLDAVKRLKSSNQFNAGNNEQLTEHYALAKAIVAKWLSKVGVSNLYSNLEHIREGKDLELVFNP
jgi:hypothetical protein